MGRWEVADFFDPLVRLGTLDRSSVRLDVVERDHIARVLDACDGNRSQAAELLGIARRTLQRKLARKKRESRRKKKRF